MAKQDMRPLSGFKDDLPEEMIPKQRMLGKIVTVFESFGFPPLDSPALEKASVLVGKYGEEGDKLLYRFRDHGDRDIALRYDLTVPLARVVASNPGLTMPFKRYQIGKVWRAERPGRGRFREFMQCDVDTVGTASMVADAECVQVICAVLDALGVPDYRVRVNNRRMLDSLLATFGVEGDERVHESLRSLDKLEKIGREKVSGLLSETAGWAPSDAERFLDQVEAGFSAIEADLPADDRGLLELREVLGICDAAGIRDRVEVDPTIARGLAYYTGTIFETFITSLPGMGSVMSGGRYDELLGQICGRDLPAVGVSLGISRLFAALKELDLVKEAKSPARVLVAYFGSETLRETYACANVLRRAGIATDLYPGKAKLGKQYKQADRIGAEAVCIIGPDEAAAGKVRVKWLESGEQREVGLDDLAEVLG